MAVDICGHLDVRVSQPLLHVFQAVALRQQHAGAGVAQVVKADVGQVVLLQKLVEGVTYVVRGVGMPVLPGEHVVVVYVVPAEVVAVVLLLLKQDLEQSNRIVCQGTLRQLDAFAAEQGYCPDFSDTRFHHEIYLGDPRRTAPEKLKTVLRHPIRRMK